MSFLTDTRPVLETLADLACGTIVGVNDAGHVVGDDHHRTRYPTSDCDLMHSLKAAGLTACQIALKFEASVHTVRSILAGRRRTHIVVGQKYLR
jgi:hypothetical protein